MQDALVVQCRIAGGVGHTFVLSFSVNSYCCVSLAVYRRRAQGLWLNKSSTGRMLTLVHGLSSLVSCILFISETYLRQPCLTQQVSGTSSKSCVATPAGYLPELPIEYLLVEQALQPVFLCHYILLLYVAINRVAYIFRCMLSSTRSQSSQSTSIFTRCASAFTRSMTVRSPKPKTPATARSRSFA